MLILIQDAEGFADSAAVVNSIYHSFPFFYLSR